MKRQSLALVAWAKKGKLFCREAYPSFYRTFAFVHDLSYISRLSTKMSVHSFRWNVVRKKGSHKSGYEALSITKKCYRFMNLISQQWLHILYNKWILSTEIGTDGGVKKQSPVSQQDTHGMSLKKWQTYLERNFKRKISWLDFHLRRILILCITWNSRPYIDRGAFWIFFSIQLLLFFRLFVHLVMENTLDMH